MSYPNSFNWQGIPKRDGYPNPTTFEWQLKHPSKPSIGHGDFDQLRALLNCSRKHLSNILHNGKEVGAVRLLNPVYGRAGQVYELDLDYAREHLDRRAARGGFYT
jgi:hypothetical protein